MITVGARWQCVFDAWVKSGGEPLKVVAPVQLLARPGRGAGTGGLERSSMGLGLARMSILIDSTAQAGVDSKQAVGVGAGGKDAAGQLR